MQYTGHEVLRTLIRCHFSPVETTGQQYIYSGGADGRIHVYHRHFSNLPHYMLIFFVLDLVS
jgi:hypothetical protein